jgi:hypothetical protein
VSFEVSLALPRRQQVEKPAESCGSVHACQLRLSGGVLGPIEVCGWFRAANLTHTQWNTVIWKVLRDNVAASCLQQIRGREVDKAENCLNNSILYPFLDKYGGRENSLRSKRTVSISGPARAIINSSFRWVSKPKIKTKPKIPNQPHKHHNHPHHHPLHLTLSIRPTNSWIPWARTGTPPPRSP